MKRHIDQSGSGATGLLIVLVVLAVVAVAGYKVWQHGNAGTTTPPTVSLHSSAPAAAVPATITNESDLNQASSSLDANDLNSLDGSSLNSDINTLL